MRTFFFARIPICIAIVFMISCNNSSKTKTEKNIDTSDTPIPLDTPSAKPPSNGESTVTRCFESNGLKYKVTINLSTGPDELGGMLYSEEMGSGKIDSIAFSGTPSGEELSVSFDGTPPPVGDASEWLNKSWRLRGKPGSEKLYILFNAKNYETNKWKETEYGFEQVNCR